MQRSAPGLVKRYKRKDCNPAGLHSLFIPGAEGIDGCSSTLYMLFFSPASQKKCLEIKQGAGLCSHVPLASLDKPVAVLLSGIPLVAVVGMPALGWHAFVSNSLQELTSGCPSEARSSVKAETPSLTPAPQA